MLYRFLDVFNGGGLVKLIVVGLLLPQIVSLLLSLAPFPSEKRLLISLEAC